MISRLISLFCLFFLVVGCSSSKSRLVYGDVTVETREETSASPETQIIKPKKAVVDRTKPANFDEYRQWRQANDPSGQTYAEYKQWEAAYRQWSKQQQTDVAR